MSRNFSILTVVFVFLAAFCFSACSSISKTGATARDDVVPTASASATTKNPTARSVAASRPVRVNGFQTIVLDELPSEALRTLALIERGGPYPYRQDGQIFQNREGILPLKPRGYYHEYTVDTPGSKDRGARRIITGAEGELYFTSDHYNSFKVIVTP